MTVEDSLETVGLWLQTNAAPLHDALNPPASAEEIGAFEVQSGLVLPNSVRAAYAVHNGEKDTSKGIFGAWRWLPLDEVISRRRQLLESDISWADRVIPVLMSGGGDFYFVESADAASGESEVFEWWHEQPAREVRHSSFAAMLEKFAGLLQKGQYVYLPDEFHGLIDRDDL